MVSLFSSYYFAFYLFFIGVSFLFQFINILLHLVNKWQNLFYIQMYAKIVSVQLINMMGYNVSSVLLLRVYLLLFSTTMYAHHHHHHPSNPLVSQQNIK